MSYVVLARKWRPQYFADLLGQEHITQTLTNAIDAERVAHAFLFSGPRGVGKTSAARILAKALCCIDKDGPVAEPCGKCQQCVEITEGRSTDVFEIDAASHTGVDNVREIIDNARYMPSSARFKIYVIDEVHMLSTPAFNALLKTLEEPPDHVKFILATTDVHKVPVTVKSRCQRYDFRRIALSRISERLSFILTDENVEHDPSALSFVAREAEGSMRDAQSLLEQVLAFAGKRKLTATLVREALGVVDSALVDRARVGLFERRPGDLIELVGDVHARGLDLPRFVGALIEHVRDLLAAHWLSKPATVLDLPEDEIEALVAHAKAASPQMLERLFEQLCRLADEVGRSSHPRFALEVGLAALAEAPARVPVDHLVSQLDRLEGLLAGGGPRGSGSRGPGGPGSGPGGPGSRSHRGPESSPSSQPQPPRPPSRPRAPGTRSSSGGASDTSVVDAKPEPPGSGPPKVSPTLEVPPPKALLEAPPLKAPPPSQFDEEPPHPADQPEYGDNMSRFGSSDETPPPLGERAGPPDSNDLPEEASESEPEAPSGPVWLRFEEPYAKYVAFVRRRRPALAATLMQVRPMKFGPKGVVLASETAFDQRKLEDRETKETLEDLLLEHLGEPAPITVQRASATSAEEVPQTLIEVEDEHEAQVRRDKLLKARAHPSVKSVIQALSGTIANVRVLGR